MVSVLIPTLLGGPVFSELFRAFARPKAQHASVISEVLVLHPKGAPVQSQKRLHAPQVRWLESAYPLYLAEACNRLVDAARTPFVLLLNDDVLLRPEWVEYMLSEYTRLEAGAVSLTECKDEAFWRQAEYAGPVPAPAVGISPSCWLFRKNLWEGLGGFDERFTPLCYEDVDFIVRMLAVAAKGNGGGLPYVLYKHLFMHVGCATRNSYLMVHDPYMERNRKKFLDKHAWTDEQLTAWQKQFFFGFSRDPADARLHPLIRQAAKV